MQYTWIDRSRGSIKNDVLSGLTVALALVPEAVAFAFVAGVSPVVGLYGALMMGVVTSIFGGRPGMISGATGAMAVVMAALVAKGNALGGDVVSLVVIFSGIPTETVASFIAARGGDSIKHYELVGPLFFGSTAQFATEFDVREDPEEVTIDFRDSRITDQSATEAINPLAEKYQKAGKRLHLRHLSKDCIRLIKRAAKICDINVLEDPEYYVAVDNYKQVLCKALGETDVKLNEDSFAELAHVGRVLQRSGGSREPVPSRAT